MTRKHRDTVDAPCPCGAIDAQGRVRTWADCCAPYLRGERCPDNAETLMRSRYTAYALGDMIYVAATWHPRTRPADVLASNGAPLQWLGLTVCAHTQLDNTHAIVAFVARFKDHGRAGKMRETSRFECIEGQWLYVDGDVA